MDLHETLVIGIGNRLRGDDAVGPLVADGVRRSLGVRAVEHTGESLSLMNVWDGADSVVLIDAVSSGASAGRIHRIDLIEESLRIQPWTCSTHAFNLPETLELARVVGYMPRRLVFFGIEGADFGIGAGVSDEVGAAVPQVVERIARELVPDGAGIAP